MLCPHSPLDLRFVSPNRKRRLAVMEGGISLAASLLPAIEPIDYVTVVPTSRSPIGRTVLKVFWGRWSTVLLLHVIIQK